MVTSADAYGKAGDPIFDDFGSEANIAGTKYDAALVLWGINYEMPDTAQIHELIDNCVWTYFDGTESKYNGSVNAGYLAVSKKNGKSIFIPAGGYETGNANGSVHKKLPLYGFYWSGNITKDNPSSAWRLGFSDKDVFYKGNYGRYYGLQIRPVSNKAQTGVAEATTSENIVKGVWKINGQYIGEDAMNLPTGTYIINGETKVVK